MKTILQIIKSLLIVVALTVLTQVGGIIYLTYKPAGVRIKKWKISRWLNWIVRVLVFCVMYLIVTIFVIPKIAKPLGRVPLPVFTFQQNTNIVPHSLFTCLTNRHYVKPEMKNLLLDVSNDLQKTYPGLYIQYLDANFPFWNGFPLLPHRSHDDGRKVDISFLYRDKKTEDLTYDYFSFFGYGFCEEPRKGEINWPDECKKRGNWYYSLLYKITPQISRRKVKFDEVANKKLLQLFARHPQTGKIFIEPHLEKRLGLEAPSKIRFHGCQAVRHDDHIHVQL